MATTSEIKAGLDEIAGVIAQNRKVLTQAKQAMTDRDTNLEDIPGKYSEIIASINIYTPDGAFETLAKDELSKLTAEFIALRTDAQAAIAALSTLTEF